MDLIKRILNENNVHKLEAENMYMMGEIMAAIETMKKQNDHTSQKLIDSETSVSLLKAQIQAMEEAQKAAIATLKTSYENKISKIRKSRNTYRSIACNEESFEETQVDQKDPFVFTSMYTTPQFNWHCSPSRQCQVETTSPDPAKAEITTEPVDETTAKNETTKGLWLYPSFNTK